MCDVTSFDSTYVPMGCRPSGLLADFERRYPNLWRSVDDCRSDRSGLPNWPEWCFFPLGGWTTLLEDYRQNMTGDDFSEASCVGALGAWRISPRICQYDPTMIESITRTPLMGDLPLDMLLRFPKWGVYIETPGMTWDGSEMYGFFAHLNWDAERDLPELRILIDDEDGLSPFMIVLGQLSLSAAIAHTASVVKSQWEALGLDYGNELNQDEQNEFAKEVSPVISLVIHFCQNAVAYSDARVPSTTARASNTDHITSCRTSKRNELMVSGRRSTTKCAQRNRRSR